MALRHNYYFARVKTNPVQMGFLGQFRIGSDRIGSRAPPCVLPAGPPHEPDGAPPARTAAAARDSDTMLPLVAQLLKLAAILESPDDASGVRIALALAVPATAGITTAAPRAAVQPAAAPAFCKMVVAVAADATGPENAAAAEMATLAGQVCKGPTLTITTPAAAKGTPQLAVGVGAATALGIAPQDLTFSALGRDGFVASSNRSAQLRDTRSYALSGAANMSGAANATSGALYACYHLLRALGVRFLAWDHTLLPKTVPSPLPELDVTFLPVFEYRDVDGVRATANALHNVMSIELLPFYSDIPINEVTTLCVYAVGCVEPPAAGQVLPHERRRPGFSVLLPRRHAYLFRIRHHQWWCCCWR